MNKHRNAGVVMAVVLAVGITGCASHERKSEEAKTAAPTSQQSSSQPSASSAEPTGLVLVPQAEFLALQQMPLAFMADSQKEFAAKNFGASASGLQAAARMLKAKQNDIPDGRAKEELSTAALSLERLAPQVRDDRRVNSAHLQALLTDIAYHIGVYHRLRAEQEWQSNRYKLAGFDMASAAAFVETGSQWVKKPADAAAIEKIRSTATKLIEGTGWSSDEVGQAVASLDSVVTSLGDKLAEASISSSPESRQPASEGADSE